MAISLVMSGRKMKPQGSESPSCSGKGKRLVSKVVCSMTYPLPYFRTLSFRLKLSQYETFFPFSRPSFGLSVCGPSSSSDCGLFDLKNASVSFIWISTYPFSSAFSSLGRMQIANAVRLEMLTETTPSPLKGRRSQNVVSIGNKGSLAALLVFFFVVGA